MDHQAARCRVIAATFGTADRICREAGGRGIAPGEETALGPSGEGRELDRIVHAKARQAVDDTRKGEFVERKEKAEKEGGGFTAGAVPQYSERLTARRMVNHFLKLMRLFILTSFIEGGNGDEQSAKSAERWEKSKLARRADVTKGIC